MPCDSIRTVSVDLSSVGKIDGEALIEALKSRGLYTGHSLTADKKVEIVYLGRGEWINVATGQSQLSPRRDVNEIKRAYSVAIVQSQAKRFGWVETVASVKARQQR